MTFSDFPERSSFDRFRWLASEQFGRFFTPPTSETVESAVNTAIADLEPCGFRRPPSPQPCGPVSMARQIWISLDRLADQIETQQLLPTERKELGLRRTWNQATLLLPPTEQSVWILIAYLGMNVQECVHILGLGAASVTQSVRVAKDQAKELVEIESVINNELSSIFGGAWRPGLGIPEADMVALFRDAVQVRSIGDTIKSPSFQLWYGLTFGRLCREYRIALCEVIQESINRDTKVWVRPAQRELKWIQQSMAARLTLRWTTAFSDDMNPFADNWYSLLRESAMPPQAVARVVAETPENVSEVVRRYEAAINRAILPPNSKGE